MLVLTSHPKSTQKFRHQTWPCRPEASKCFRRNAGADGLLSQLLGITSDVQSFPIFSRDLAVAPLDGASAFRGPKSPK